jgi:molybdenum cofactor cytidylyltransferase
MAKPTFAGRSPKPIPPPFAAIILGAGASSRMGRPKLLLPWKDTTVIGHLVRQWRELGATQIAVVGRPNDATLVEALKRDASKRGAATTLQRFNGSPFNASTDYIVNPQPERGMFSSIVCAANWTGWKSEIASFAIILGDQPQLQLNTLRVLLGCAAQHPDAICQLEFAGRPRHPVLLPRRAFAELKDSRAESLKDFLKRISCPSVQYVINDPNLTLDLDTPEDYELMRASLNL